MEKFFDYIEIAILSIFIIGMIILVIMGVIAL